MPLLFTMISKMEMKSEEELKLASSLLRSLAEPPASGGAAPETPDATSVTSADPS